MDRNIPFQLRDIGNTIYEHWIAKDLVAYLKLAIDDSYDEGFIRIINKPTRYMSKAIIGKIKEKNKTNILSGMISSNLLENWQHNRIEELVFSLKALKKRNSHDAIVYIRKGIGYDDYIKEYSNYRKIKPKALFEILDEIQEASTAYSEIKDFINHIENVIINTKNKKK